VANEIKITVGVTYANVALKDTIASETFSVNQSAQEFTAPVVSVGTSEEDLPLPDITTNGYIYLRNLDTTNYVKYGPKSAGNMVEYGRILAGEVAILRLAPGITMRWIANSSAVKVLVKAYGN
jgi:hypothetical protein